MEWFIYPDGEVYDQVPEWKSDDYTKIEKGELYGFWYRSLEDKDTQWYTGEVVDVVDRGFVVMYVGNGYALSIRHENLKPYMSKEQKEAEIFKNKVAYFWDHFNQQSDYSDIVQFLLATGMLKDDMPCPPVQRPDGL